MSADTGTDSLRPQTDRVCTLMLALSDPNRVGLLESLRAGEASVQELADELGLPHRNTSHHAAMLHRAGVLGRRRDGRLAVYKIEDWTAVWLLDQAMRACSDADS